MPTEETALIFPVTVTNGTLASQASFAFATDFIQRFEIALAMVAEYVINQESSSDANYADRAYFARFVANNPEAYSLELAALIAADPATIFTSCTDQQILDRIWTIWPVASYLASTILAPV